MAAEVGPEERQPIACHSWIWLVLGHLNYQPNYVPDSIFWIFVNLIVLGGLAVLAGIVVQLAAWVAALFNTNRLMDKTWFTVLLVCGIVGIVLGPLFGLGALCWGGAMISYLIGAPDGMAAVPPQLREMPIVPPKTLAPTGQVRLAFATQLRPTFGAVRGVRSWNLYLLLHGWS
jgi:hypothetical protein